MAVTRRGLLAGAGVLAVTGAGYAQSRELVVFAAASLKNALDAIAIGQNVKISYGASNLLAKQIEQGAPADLFFSADLDWMTYLEGRKLIRPGSRVDLLGNRIVLIAPKASLIDVKLLKGVDLVAALGREGRLAMATVDAVPAGKYGKAALEALGAWDGVRTKVAQADNVRAALALVARGEAAMGVVYATDAAAEPGVRILDGFPDGTHPPILYPVAITAESRHPDAAAFLTHLRGDAARRIFEAQGFTTLNRPWIG